MPEPGEHTLIIDDLIKRLAAGDDGAREKLLQAASNRLTHITRKILRDFPEVQRWEQTADVFQNASLRLYRSLGEVKPTDVRHFYRLAALQIRRELIDLARHYRGPEGMGAHHQTIHKSPEAGSSSPVLWEQEGNRLIPSVSPSGSISTRQSTNCPRPNARSLTLVWYHGLAQQEAAKILGVDERTIRRRWREARLKLHELLGGDMPELE